MPDRDNFLVAVVSTPANIKKHTCAWYILCNLIPEYCFVFAANAGWFWGHFFTIYRNQHCFHDFIVEAQLKFGNLNWQLLLPFRKSPIVILAPNEANMKWILKTNFASYAKPAASVEPFGELFGKGIFASDGDEWRHQRKLASHMFSMSSLRDHMTKIFASHGETVCELIQSNSNESTTVDIQMIFFRYTMTTFLEIGFGQKVDGIREAQPFELHFDRAQSLMVERFLDPAWKIKRRFELGQREQQIKASVMFLDQFARECIEQRRGDISTGKYQDLISRALSSAAGSGAEVPFSSLRDLVLNFLVAGRDTTACSLTWAVYRLCLHPEAEASILAELKAAGPLQSGPALFHQLANLKYMEAFLLEVLRLHPPVPMDAKECIRDDILPDGTRISAGTTISYRPYLFGRSPLLWKDPLVFDPRRFLSSSGSCEEEDSGESNQRSSHSDYKFIAFNAGFRLCLGRSLALLEARCLLAQVIKELMQVARAGGLVC